MPYRRILLWAGVAIAWLGLGAWAAHAQTGSVGGTGGARTVSSGGSSSSSTSMGGGFTGGGSTSSGGFTGGSGGSSSTSGGFTGGTTTSTGKGGTSSTAVPTSSNPWLSTYGNPLTMGLLDSAGKPTFTKAFGQATYPTYSSSTTGTTGGFGGATGGFGGGTSSTSYSFNTGGIAYPPNYITVAGDSLPVVVHSNPKLQGAVSNLLQRSTLIRPIDPYKVSVNGSTVTIEGTVASAKEKRVVEGMIRMTPGVREVINNLQVAETLPNPKAGLPIGP